MFGREVFKVIKALPDLKYMPMVMTASWLAAPERIGQHDAAAQIL